MTMDTQELKDEGYRVGVPYWGLIDGASIDRNICAESKCDNCGHQGMGYESYIRDEPRSYRAFAVCPQCGAKNEF